MSDKDWLDKNGHINFEILEEGARRNAEERAEQQRIIREKETARQRAEDAKLNALLDKVAESVAADNKSAADAAIAEEIAEAEAVIREKQNKLHNVKEESVTDKAWREMFSTLKGEKKND